MEAPNHVIGVGGVVVRNGAVLLVRQTYGTSRGRYLFPGGHVDPGETLDQAVVREVREETGLETRPRGIIAVRSRYDGMHSDTYIVFLLDVLTDSEPVADGRENDDARFFTREELDNPMAPIAELTRYVARRVLDGTIHLQSLADDFNYTVAGRNPLRWRLFC